MTVSCTQERGRCNERNIGMKSNRCALPKNHGGACRAPRTGDFSLGQAVAHPEADQYHT